MPQRSGAAVVFEHVLLRIDQGVFAIDVRRCARLQVGALPMVLGAQNAQVIERIGVALGGGQGQKLARLRVVGGYALAVRVHQAQVVLGRGVTLVGGFAVPLGGQFGVGRQFAPLRQHQAELELRIAVALYGS